MNNTLPTIRSYGEYSSDNYGVNSLEVTIGQLTLYFSYQTVIAYRTHEDGLVIRKNDWSTTTGKHLNWIDTDKSKRIEGEEFEAKLAETLKRFGLEG